MYLNSLITCFYRWDFFVSPSGVFQIEKKLLHSRELVDIDFPTVKEMLSWAVILCDEDLLKALQSDDHDAVYKLAENRR